MKTNDAGYSEVLGQTLDDIIAVYLHAPVLMVGVLSTSKHSTSDSSCMVSEVPSSMTSNTSQDGSSTRSLPVRVMDTFSEDRRQFKELLLLRPPRPRKLKLWQLRWEHLRAQSWRLLEVKVPDLVRELRCLCRGSVRWKQSRGAWKRKYKSMFNKSYMCVIRTIVFGVKNS
jgi:hypothetical protein